MAGTNGVLGPVTLRVADLGRQLAFYSDVLGLAAAAEGRDAGALAVLRAGREALLQLQAVPGAPSPPPGCTGLYHVALRLPHRTALGRVLVRLVDIGYPLEGGADHLVSEAVYLRDPEGNGLELYVDRPRETWTWDGRSVRMGTEPLDWRSLLAEGRAAGPAGLPDEVVVGHVHLTVSRLDRAERFYHGILGLDVTLRYGPSALFLSYGGYHHHVGCNTWAGVGAPPPPPGCTGLVRFSLRLDAATLADVRVRAEKAGFDVTDGADGWQLSDPDGVGVELLPLA